MINEPLAQWQMRHQLNLQEFTMIAAECAETSLPTERTERATQAAVPHVQQFSGKVLVRRVCRVSSSCTYKALISLGPRTAAVRWEKRLVS